MSFPQALEELFLEGRRPLVVAGTHGKTTSASMLAFGARALRARPGMAHRRRAARSAAPAPALGGSPWFVVEGDEYDSAYFDKEAKFLHYRPDTLLLTAVEFDHADIYRDLDAREGGASASCSPCCAAARRWWRAATSRTSLDVVTRRGGRVAALRARRDATPGG